MFLHDCEARHAHVDTQEIRSFVNLWSLVRTVVFRRADSTLTGAHASSLRDGFVLRSNFGRRQSNRDTRRSICLGVFLCNMRDVVSRVVLVDCPAGHALTKFVSDLSCLCGTCHSELSLGATMWGCRVCDFDLCEACYSAEQDNKTQRDARLEEAA